MRKVPQVQVPAVWVDTRGKTVELTPVSVASSHLDSSMHPPIAASPAHGDTSVSFGENGLETVMAEHPSSTRETAEIEEERETLRIVELSPDSALSVIYPVLPVAPIPPVVPAASTPCVHASRSVRKVRDSHRGRKRHISRSPSRSGYNSRRYAGDSKVENEDLERSHRRSPRKSGRSRRRRRRLSRSDMDSVNSTDDTDVDRRGRHMRSNRSRQGRLRSSAVPDVVEAPQVSAPVAAAD